MISLRKEKTKFRIIRNALDYRISSGKHKQSSEFHEIIEIHEWSKWNHILYFTLYHKDWKNIWGELLNLDKIAKRHSYRLYSLWCHYKKKEKKKISTISTLRLWCAPLTSLEYRIATNQQQSYTTVEEQSTDKLNSDRLNSEAPTMLRLVTDSLTDDLIPSTRWHLTRSVTVVGRVQNLSSSIIILLVNTEWTRLPSVN